MTQQPVPVPEGLVETFWEFERALMADDAIALRRMYALGTTTVRGDGDGLLVGHEQISALHSRPGQGPAAPRRIVQTHVQTLDRDHALVIAVIEPTLDGQWQGGRGQQTQLWARTPEGWRITAAHLTDAAPALDTRVWRLVGDPLVPPLGSGVLDGESVAVKDLYAVRGQRIGAGNPARLADARVEPVHARAVEMLLEAGASVRGIAQTDEFAFALTGLNAHTGPPPNPRVPFRIPGGSSSGSASAVSLGHAAIGLGTDTAGSVRVPAAYQGLYGIRTSHGAVSSYALLPLSPSFDAVGWLTRSASLLHRVGTVLLPSAPVRPAARDLVVVPGLTRLAEDEVADVVDRFAAEHGAMRESWDLADLSTWLHAFGTLESWEAWREHGPWLAARLSTLGEDVRGRFEAASLISEERADAARSLLAAARERILSLVGDRVVVLPSAASVAPLLGGGFASVRDATMALTCLAPIAGLPGVSLPRTTRSGLPTGVGLLAGPGRDLDLLELAVELG